MRVLGRISDHFLELVFSTLRWIFVVLATFIFMKYYHHTPLDLEMFGVLFTFAVVYMVIAQFALLRSSITSPLYILMTKGGTLFDVIAWLCLIWLTGGGASPFFPIAFLIELHVAVYWSYLGGVVSSLFLGLGYVATIVLTPGRGGAEEIPLYVMNCVFLVMIGALGGLIVGRERKHLSEKSTFETMAKRDFLTGLYNHRTFQDHLKTLVKNRTAFTLAMGDIDAFKGINDRYGHMTGDDVLQYLGTLFENRLADGAGLAYRYGGEEFALILYTGVEQVAQQILSNIQGDLQAYGERRPFTVTMSWGAVSTADVPVCEPRALLERADALLYKAKHRGKNCIVWTVDSGEGIS